MCFFDIVVLFFCRRITGDTQPLEQRERDEEKKVPTKEIPTGDPDAVLARQLAAHAAYMEQPETIDHLTAVRHGWRPTEILWGGGDVSAFLKKHGLPTSGEGA